MVEEAVGFLRRHRERPFFLYFAMNMPHYPYQGDPKWLALYAALPYPRSLYAAFLSTQDERIGRLLAEVDALGLRERTIVILQSDNGHSTEERAHSGGGTAGPYRGAKFSLFEGGIRLPAILSWPGRLPEDQVRSQMAHACDWLPTIAELCGVPLGEGDIDGKSLVGVLRSADVPSPHGILHWTMGAGWAVRDGEWKLLVGARDTSLEGPAAQVETPFLVHLGDDPGERRNLARGRPEVVERLRKTHEEWWGGIPEGRRGR
jgi:arylsulfatase A-like enzyme